jgi:hypothetical protein
MMREVLKQFGGGRNVRRRAGRRDPRSGAEHLSAHGRKKKDGALYNKTFETIPNVHDQLHEVHAKSAS